MEKISNLHKVKLQDIGGILAVKFSGEANNYDYNKNKQAMVLTTEKGASNETSFYHTDTKNLSDTKI